MLGWISLFAKEEEMTGTLLSIEEEGRYSFMLAFSFLQYFYSKSSDKKVTTTSANICVSKSLVHMFGPYICYSTVPLL